MKSAPAGIRPLPYVAYERLGERPHVMVDGAARPGSVVTLSHWPHSPTPPALARDLSAEIVFAFIGWVRSGTRNATTAGLDRAAAARLREGAARAEAVTNDHFDEDGLMSVFALVDPEFALSRAELVCDVAACGDFGVVRSDDAAKAAFAIGPLADELAGEGAGTCERYEASVGVVRSVLEDPDAYERYWRPEMALFEAGREAISRGEVTIEQLPGDDLAVVRRHSPEALPGAADGLPVHAVALHSATPCTRVLAFDGSSCSLTMRYEGWVKYTSRAVARRPDLGPLAEELTSLEPAGVTWDADGPGAIISGCRPSGSGETDLSPDVVTERVVAYLRRAPGAWDPFA